MFDHGGTIFSTAKRLGVAPDQLLDLSASINPLGISPAARKAIISGIDSIGHYPDPASLDLARAVAGFHQLPLEAFVPSNGSTAIIHLLPSVFGPGKALIIGPAFSEYAHALLRHNWETCWFLLNPEDGFKLDIEKLEQAICSERPKMLFFCNPANPSGVLYSRQTVRAILELCSKYGTIMVLDEAFMDFCGEQHSSIDEIFISSNGIALRSMTKFYSIAGLRLGYAIANPHLAERVRNCSPPWEVNHLAQLAGVASIQDRVYAERTRQLIADEREWLLAKLNNTAGIRVSNSSANYLLLELPEGTNSQELCQLMLDRHKIMLRDCSNFKGLSDRFIRVAIRGRDENSRFIDCFMELL